MTAVAVVLGLASGVPLDWSLVWQTDSSTHRIFFELRLPRVIFVFFAGASLAGVGAVYQILFHNPLAEPYLLGVSSATTLGIAAAEVFLGIAATSVASQAIGLTCALVVTALLLAMTLSDRGGDAERIVLFGLGTNFVLSSVLFLLLSYQLQHIGGGSMRWLFGQVPWVGLDQALRFSGGAVLAGSLLWLGGRSLDALAFGDGVASSLGSSPRRARFFFLGVTSVLMAWLVSFTGSIGFLGLVVPHTARLMFRPSTTRGLLLLSWPMGGAFLIIADAISRVLLPPLEFPVGILTTLIGGPLFLVLLWKR